MTRWNEHLVRPGADGSTVVAAGPQDEALVATLFAYWVDASVFVGRCVEPFALQSWVRGILSSHLYLVLVLRGPDGSGQGLAVCEYAAYEVDPSQRILKCRYLCVLPGAGTSLRSGAGLLVDALVEAARRSPQVVDVFLITFGASRLDTVRRACERRQFRRIGTQHLGLRRFVRQDSRLVALETADVLAPSLREQLRAQGEAFFLESTRCALSPRRPDLDRLIAQSLGNPRSGAAPVGFLALRDGRLAGFITAAPARIGPMPLRLLQSTFFYVDPVYRGAGVGLSLFDALSGVAARDGYEGIYLGTSGEIDTERTCRLLDLRGYQHRGDVLALRVGPPTFGVRA